MMMAKMLVLFVLCVGLTLTNACSCFTPFTPDRFCSYNIIFRGVAVSEYKDRELPLDFSDLWFDDSDWVYSVRVDQAIRMPENLKKETVTMRTATQESLCGRRFQLDVDSIFVGTVNSAGEMSTGLCQPNAPWDYLTSEEQELLSHNYEDYCANRTNST